MLEQPPERSQAEIEMEAAAPQISHSRRGHWLLRGLIWCMPTFFCYGFVVAATYLSDTLLREMHELVGIALFSILLIGSTYGLGCVDGFFSLRSLRSKLDKRQPSIVSHAGKFFVNQLWIIPSLIVTSIIFLMIVIDLFDFGGNKWGG